MKVTYQEEEAHALEVERRRREIFVATLAHELRQPLSSLLAAVEVVRRECHSAVAGRATEVMKRQISQMNRMIDDLVDAARWAHGAVSLRRQLLDLREVIRDAEADIRAALAERGQQLAVAIGSEPLWVDGDAQRLQQVLSNLLRNAVKYTEPAGRVRLTAERGTSVVTLRVSDTGRGIAPESLTQIFELFSQVRSADAAGLGIGLSVVREIVTLHQGRIEARSQGLGRGSEFIITLPLAAADAGRAGGTLHFNRASCRTLPRPVSAASEPAAGHDGTAGASLNRRRLVQGA